MPNRDEVAYLLRLEEALKPFADFAGFVERQHPGWDHDKFEFHIEGMPRMDAFRQARKVLSLVQTEKAE